MKNLMKIIVLCGFVSLIATLISCGSGKEFSYSNSEDASGTFRVIEVADKTGKSTPYLELQTGSNTYRVLFKTEKEATNYFNTIKKEYGAKEKESEGSGMLTIFSYMDNFDLHVSGKKEILYVDLNKEPNYAETGGRNADDLIDEYERLANDFVYLMNELSEADLTKKQERRLIQLAKSLAATFGE